MGFLFPEIMTPILHKEESFDGLGIAPKLLEILDALRFTAPTPIQYKSIPVAIEGKDIIGIAQTGTGKTLAFGIPMIQRLAIKKGMGLVLLPTRELAEQVNTELHKIGKSLGLRTALVIGGASMWQQKKMLKTMPHVIISTPGRLVDLLQQRAVNLSPVNVLVLDEADRMLDIGFAPQLGQILKVLPTERQTMLFSATMPHEIVALATKYMKLPLRFIPTDRLRSAVKRSKASRQAVTAYLSRLTLPRVESMSKALSSLSILTCLMLAPIMCTASAVLAGQDIQEELSPSRHRTREGMYNQSSACCA